jgi:hypothetical protein
MWEFLFHLLRILLHLQWLPPARWTTRGWPSSWMTLLEIHRFVYCSLDSSLSLLLSHVLFLMKTCPATRTTTSSNSTGHLEELFCLANASQFGKQKILNDQRSIAMRGEEAKLTHNTQHPKHTHTHTHTQPFSTLAEWPASNTHPNQHSRDVHNQSFQISREKRTITVLELERELQDSHSVQRR